MEIQSLGDMQTYVRAALLAYNRHLLDDAKACDEECEFAYAQQRLDQVKEFYPVMTEVLTMLGRLTPFKE